MEYYPPTMTYVPGGVDVGAPTTMREGGIYTPPGVTTPQQKKEGWFKTDKTSWTGCLPLMIFIIVVIIWLIVTLFTPGTAKAKILSILIGIIWALIWAFFIWIAWKAGYHVLAWILAAIAIIIWTIMLILLFHGNIVIAI